MGGAFALDWPAVERCARLLSIDLRSPRVMDGIRLLEGEELRRVAGKRKD
jgi:hypothetical protein